MIKTKAYLLPPALFSCGGGTGSGDDDDDGEIAITISSMSNAFK